MNACILHTELYKCPSAHRTRDPLDSRRPRSRPRWASTMDSDIRQTAARLIHMITIVELFIMFPSIQGSFLFLVRYVCMQFPRFFPPRGPQLIPQDLRLFCFGDKLQSRSQEDAYWCVSFKPLALYLLSRAGVKFALFFLFPLSSFFSMLCRLLLLDGWVDDDERSSRKLIR